MSFAEKQVWEEVVRSNAMGLADLVVPGTLIANVSVPSHIRPVPHPSPFPDISYCPCGEREVNIAQFWHASRLWRVCFCPGSDDCQRVNISSLPATPSLPEGSNVQGNSAWSRTPTTFLHEPGTKAWEAHAEVLALGPMLGKSGEGEDDLYKAACDIFGAQRNSTRSRLGGVATFIQWPHEPVCPHCRQDLSLVCQLGPDTSFHWADAGQLYVFYCPTHPKQVEVYLDTH